MTNFINWMERAMETGEIHETRFSLNRCWCEKVSQEAFYFHPTYDTHNKWQYRITEGGDTLVVYIMQPECVDPNKWYSDQPMIFIYTGYQLYTGKPRNILGLLRMLKEEGFQKCDPDTPVNYR